MKTKAFEYALQEYPQSKVNLLIKYHKINGGLSRYEKFDHFFSEIVSTAKDKKSILKSLERFSQFVNEGIKSCSMVKGARNFLEFLKKTNRSIYIVSGADHKELNQIFRSRNIDHYFKAIYGSPGDKISYVNEIKKKEKSESGLFFGDSLIDFEASLQSKLDFIYVKKHSEWSPNKIQIQKMKLSINDFEDLKVT